MVKIKINRLLIWALVFGCVLQSTLAQTDTEAMEFKLDSEIIGYLEEGQQQNYILNLDQPIDEDQYLIITAEGTFEGSEPDIFINKQKFDTTNDSDIICKSFGFALCHIKKSQIKNYTKLFVSVKCHSKCGFEITAFVEEAKSQINMRLNDITYGIFEDSQGKTDNQKLILQKVVQMKFGKEDIAVQDTLENLIIEFELMNPIESYTTFNVYFNFNDIVPTRARCHSWGQNWGSGAGMGVFVQNKKTQNIPDSGTYTMTIEAHEGAIIAIRSYGWGEQRIIKPFELVSGFTFSGVSEMKYQLRLDTKYKNHFDGKNLIVGLVPFQGDPNLYADFKSFSELKKIEDYQWVSDELFDDRITFSSKDLENKDFLNINIASKDQFTLFTLRAYYPIGKIPLNFDYPEAGTLHAQELIQYSLSLYGNQETNITLTLKPREGKPGLMLKKCKVDEKEKCVFTQDDNKQMIFPKFDAEKVVYKFQSKPKECSQYNVEGLNVCYYLIGIQNVDETNDVRYSLTASNGITHTILQEDETYHEGIDFGKINYYMLNLTNTKYTNITQVSFQLSNVQGQVSMFTSFENIRPTVNDKIKQSFYHSLHLYTEELGDLNRVIYLGIQSDSSFSSYNLQVKIIEDMNFSYYVLEENVPILVTEDASKVKKIHFKFFLRKSFNQDLKVKVLLEALSGYYDMKLGLDPQNIDEFESQSNFIEFSTKQVQFTKYDQPIYGIITPRMTWLNNKIQFKIQYITSSVIHQNLNLGIVNQIRISQEEQYFKIAIHSNESIMISKSVMNQLTKEDDVNVIVSYDQSNIKPQLNDLNAIKLTNFIPQIISDENFKLHCKAINEYSVENNCFLFITVKANKEALLMLYADVDTSAQFIFTDFPNVVSYKPKQDKKLFYPELFNKQFNLFKSASMNGDELIICAKVFNNTLKKSNWPYPVGCKPGEYDFKFNTQGDENYFYEINENNELCDFKKKQCGLSIYLIDSSFSLWGMTDSITLTLQQSHTTLHPGLALIDSLPQNGARFYYIELSEIKDQRFIIAATEYVDESIELILYIDKEKVYSTNKKLPYITVDKEFKTQLKKKYNFDENSQFGIEVKSLVKSKEVSYSIILTISQNDETALTHISLGKPLQIQLSDDKDYQYFIFRNKQVGETFKIILAQQTQGYTQITVNRFNSIENLDLPLKKYLIQTYENIIQIDETKEICVKRCIYIIQLKTKEKQGASLSLTVQREEIQLLENISSQNELKANQKAMYYFNSLKKSQLTIDLQSGDILLEVTNNNGEKLITQQLKAKMQYKFDLKDLTNINDQYHATIISITDSQFFIKYVNENTIPQISYDQPLKDQKISPDSSMIYTIQTSGEKVINIQLQFYYDGQYKEGVSLIEETFESDQKPIKRTLISSTFDRSTSLFIRHIQIMTTEEMSKIIMKLENKQMKGNIKQLSVYISQNFTILDQGMPMFYYFGGSKLESNLYGIILPQKERKIFVEITYLKGEIHSEGTYSRDSALNNNFQFTFTSGNRQTLEVDVSTANFYIKLTGLEAHSQGYIKFITFPSKTILPFGLLRKPENDHPTLTGVKSLENLNEYSAINFTFEPLVCSKNFVGIPGSNSNGFELVAISYTLMIVHEKQLAYGTDFIFSQIPGDLTSIEQKIKVYYDYQNNEGNHTALFFTFEETPQCYSQCSQCKVKEMNVPLENDSFNQYISNASPTVIVRATILWRYTQTYTEFTQNVYYSEVTVNKETILPTIPQELSGSEGVSVMVILSIITGSLILIFLLIFYFRKYKQTEKRLNFELTDVRNVANMTSSNSVIPSSHLKHIPLDEEIQE